MYTHTIYHRAGGGRPAPAALHVAGATGRRSIIIIIVIIIPGSIIIISSSSIIIIILIMIGSSINISFIIISITISK